MYNPIHFTTWQLCELKFLILRTMTDNKDRINQSQFLKYLVTLLSDTVICFRSLIVQDLKTLLVRNASLCPVLF